MKTRPLAEVHAEQVITRLRRREGPLYEMAADLIDQLRQRLTEIEVECREAWKQAAYWRPRAEQAEAKLKELGHE